MPPVFGPWSLSNTRLWSCAVASGTAFSPSLSTKKLASSPVRNSSTTNSLPRSACAERRLRPDHDEVVSVRLADRDHRRVVRDVERDAFGLARDAGIAGRAEQLVGQRARRDLPGERVLAPARAEKEDVHARCRPQ